MVDLTEELKKHKFTLSRTAVYLRPIAMRHNTTQGKRHVTSVPVKLCRACSEKRNKNPDCWFVSKSMEHAEELASPLGPALTSFIRQDDKAHVSVGVAATNKQTALLISVKYEAHLPDHDFIIAPKHKLTPAVIGLREVRDTRLADGKKVKDSVHTVIQVKSLKHTPSNASAQIEAFDNMVKTEEMSKLSDRSTKPILILIRDRNDGLQFLPTRNKLISIFKEHDLDYNFVCAMLKVYWYITSLQKEWPLCVLP